MLLLGVELTEVELELLALKDVTVSATALAGARGDASKKTTVGEEVGDLLLELNLGTSGVSLLGDRLGAGVLLKSVLGTALAEEDVVLLLEVRTERSSIDLNDSVLDKGLGADKLVVGGVVNDIKDTSLGGVVLRTPREVAGLEAESTLLQVATHATDVVDTNGLSISDKLGVGSGAAELKLSLLLVDVDTTTGGTTLIAGGASNTYISQIIT